MRPASQTLAESHDYSGEHPNCILLVGSGFRADILRAALEPRCTVIPLGAADEPAPSAVFVEAAGDHRHEQLAALRQISAQAPDEAIILTTSPILSQIEIAGSMTHPSRTIGLVPPWSSRSRMCEVIRGPHTSRQAVNQALEVACLAGWTPLMQHEGGPSAMTRLCGAVIVSSWNLAQRTGRPEEVDRAARQWGLTWSPLREIDGIGVARLAAIFDRSGQVGGIESIYLSLADETPSEAFGAKCGNDLIEADDKIGYLLQGAVEATRSLKADGLAPAHRDLRRLLAAAFGRRVARKVSRAISVRYPEMTSRSPTTAPA